MEYLVLKRLWHTADERYYSPGAGVDLSHVGLATRELLVKKRVVVPLNEYNELQRVKGIGQEYARALIEVGVRGIDDLLAVDAVDLSRRLDTGPGQVERWQAYARDTLEGNTDGNDHSTGS